MVGYSVFQRALNMHFIGFRFENQLVEYRQRIEEMERLLLVNTEKENSYGSQLSLLQSLPSVMINVHDFFIHVAAEVSDFHLTSMVDVGLNRDSSM